MEQISSNPFNADYTFRAAAEVKHRKISSKIMAPLRKAIGSSVGKELGQIRLSRTEKQALKDKKAELIANGEGKNIKIAMQNKKGTETHQLDGILINNPNESTEDKRYIVVFYGMGDGYEKHLESMKKLAEDTDATVVSFNYRGKGESTGKANSVKDYAMDGRAFIEYLKIEEGADPEKIMLYGHSLGGGVAAKVCEEIDHKGPIVLDSTFSTFKKASEYKKGAFTSWIIKKAGWSINNVQALEKVEGSKLGLIVNRRDPTVHYERAGLYNQLKADKVEKEIETVKIGAKPSRERLDGPTVKAGKKNFNEERVDKEPATEESDPTYKNLQTDLKKAGWMRFVRHPHQLVMDQEMDPDEISMPHKIIEELAALKGKVDSGAELQTTYDEKEKLAEDLLELNKKYAHEDNLAYGGMVNMIKGLFDKEEI